MHVKPILSSWLEQRSEGMRRFTLRGQGKMSAQWKLFTMVHNIEKVAGVAWR
jgi:hypothetical protein